MTPLARTNEVTHPNKAAFPSGVSGPALRALKSAGVCSVADLSRWTESDLAALHGMGPKALDILREALKATGKAFKALVLAAIVAAM
jgi:predicted flap endonuclease-1-like 5' DNA nuclease